MQVFKRSSAGRIGKPQPVAVVIMGVSSFDGSVMIQAGNTMMRVERGEIQRIAGAAGMVDSYTILTNLRSLAASLAG
ncbi:hypothetical protein AWB77_06733 [Caballeronia fortuita]|uniref:Uncharacterized protein n=1 Tax=Caballeronia fortuita TaxID=1777138 RepID=A0A158EBB4_9BURK|nr:hypothetical protein [Caballeronia fortuita]SAL03197.1 hypothetical protein AWB77_06733 [Caballeronia fortuita]